MTQLSTKETTGFKKKAIAGQVENIWESNLFHLLVFVTLASILFFPTITGLISEWYSKPNASHGFLIPIIVFLLVWKKKDQIKPVISDQRDTSGLTIAATSLLFYFAGKWSMVLILCRTGFVIFLIGSIIFLIGKRAARKISFPLAYSLFMIPLPITLYDQLTFPMKKLATYTSVQIISLMSIPVLREGNIIHMPTATLEVVNACSGLNSVISVLALGTLWGYIYLDQNSRRWIFALCLIPIAIVANVVRIIVTALTTNYYSSKFAEGLMHELSGTVLVLLVATIFLTFLSRVLRKL